MKAFFVITLALLVISIASMLLAVFEPDMEADAIIYEVVSAFATVGLTMGITPHLSAASKIVLIVVMFMGRVGVITILASFAKTASGSISYLEEKIVIG